jgi:hypothetical protein
MKTDSKFNEGVNLNLNKINLETDVVKKPKIKLKKILKKKSDFLKIVIKIINQPVNIFLNELLSNFN